MILDPEYRNSIFIYYILLSFCHINRHHAHIFDAVTVFLWCYSVQTFDWSLNIRVSEENQHL